MAATAVSGRAQPAEKLWAVDHTGWRIETRADSEVYVCLVCAMKVEIQAASWPLSGIVAGLSPQQFAVKMQDEGNRRALADEAIRSAARNVAVPRFTIEETRLTKLGGIDVMEYRAALQFGSTKLREISTFGVHRGRAVKTSVVYVDRELDVTERAAVNGWMRGLRYL